MVVRAGRGNTCSDTMTKGSGGKGRDKVTWTLGTGPWEEAFEDGWGRWHASRGLSHRYWGAAGNLGSTEGEWLLGLGEGYLIQHQGQRQIGRWTRQQAEPSNTSVGSARKTNL